MYNIREFKNDFRFICTDVWGDALDAWFEATGQLCMRWIDIPSAWQYKAGLCPIDEDSYFNEVFANCTDDEITAIANFLFRYCQMLKHNGKDY